MNRYLIALALATQVSNAVTTCEDGEWFNEEMGECDTCIQFTTNPDRLNLEQGDCPPIEFVEPVCTAVIVDMEEWRNQSGRRVLCGGTSLFATAAALVVATSLLN